MAATELDGVELGLQRACALGLLAFTTQAAAVAVAGASLYPVWWFLGPGAVAFGATLATIVRCLRNRSRPTERLAAALVIASGCVLTAVATAESVDEVGTATSAIVSGLVLVLGLLDRAALALPVGVVLIAAQLGAVALTRPLPWANWLVVTSIQVAVLLAGTAAGRAVRRIAARQDLEQARLAYALSVDRVLAATRADRREQDRRLHDTVLGTLTALARGSPDSPRLRERCAADARHLRERSIPETEDGLLERLRTVARLRTEPGFAIEVEGEGDASDLQLPEPVVAALCGAAGEAVANAAQHSGAASARIVVTAGALGGVLVEVVDAGSGSAPDPSDIGLGVRRSIIERMVEVGGDARVEHRAGRGTLVVLTWPR